MKTGTVDKRPWLTGILLVALAALPPASIAADAGPGRLRLDLQDNQLHLEAAAVPLGEVIDAIGDQMAIDFQGLEAQRKQPIDWTTTAGSPEILAKKLLRHLGARNFACEYIDNRLVKVIVFPQAGWPTMPAAPAAPSDAPAAGRQLTVIEVVDVIEETQAAALNIEPGDIILKYDGVRIGAYDDLIEESTREHGSRMIQMILLRKQRLISVFLEGGYIGVRIRAKRIPSDAIPPDLDAW
jgi:hypothetical protein